MGYDNSPPPQAANVPSTGQAQISPSYSKAPRISAALLSATAGGTADYQTSIEKQLKSKNPSSGKLDPINLRVADKAAFTAQVKQLCTHIGERLAGTLDEAWVSADGYNSSASFKALLVKARAANTTPSKHPDAKGDLLAEAQAWDLGEETWARAFAEMAVFTMYQLPGVLYGHSDKFWYQKYPSIYSIGMECQILSTYCMLTRGFSLDSLKGGLGCAAAYITGGAFVPAPPAPKAGETPPANPPPSSQIKPMKTQPDAKLPYKDQQAAIKQEAEVDPGGEIYTAPWANVAGLLKNNVKPGSVIIWNPGGSAYTGQDIIKFKSTAHNHVASVLRVGSTKIQVIDTGVQNGNEGGAGENGTEGGTIDHGFLSSNAGLDCAGGIVAFGAALPVDDSKLLDCAKTIAGAKPLGLTRLVIATTDKKVLFVSKLLHMRWPVAKLMWSLRNLPVDGLLVGWFVWGPANSAPAKAVFKGNWADVVADAAASASPAPSTLLTQTSDTKPKPNGGLTIANVIMGYPDGHVEAYRYKATSPNWAMNFTRGTSPKDIQAWMVVEAGKDPKAAKGTKLSDWCESFDNFGNCWIRTVSDTDAGAAGTDAIGDKLVDP